VKLVAQSGVGTIAAGVAKAKADVILISGHNGGTGASPQTSIKYAGVPWEMGLTEAHQVLALNNLRDRITLRTDGGLRTGRDIVMAAMMGAEEYGIGTAALISMGCIMVRQCHSNTCPVGVCTQDPRLREKFTGSAEKVVNLMTFYAEEVREILASLGARSLDEIIGRADLLTQVSRGASHLDDLDLNPMLIKVDNGGELRLDRLRPRTPVPDTLDAQIVADAQPFFRDGEKMQLSYAVQNTQRTIGARVSSHIVRKFGMHNQLQPDHLTLVLTGSCGQSLGAFAAPGLKIVVQGDANDYVGKGLSGGTIVVRPAVVSSLVPHENVIIGNTVLYGATAGRLYASGRAGERFCVRNSGAEVVVEGCGSNGCEYMTGGVAVILGRVGDNFGAGMTGGMAYVYDADGTFEERINAETIVVRPVRSAHWERVLKGMIEDHLRETASPLARDLLHDWAGTLPRFRQVCPKEMLPRLAHPLEDAEAVRRA
jgi:glutamate synthase (NADPH/NADH) large chain